MEINFYTIIFEIRYTKYTQTSNIVFTLFHVLKFNTLLHKLNSINYYFTRKHANIKQTEHIEFAVDDRLFIDNRREQNIAPFILNATSVHLDVILAATGHCSMLAHLLLNLRDRENNQV